MQNLVDWSVADVELLSIRSRGSYARTLKPMDESSRSTYELANYGLVVLALGLIVGLAYTRRRNVVPLAVSQKRDDDGKRGDEGQR